MIEPKSVAVDFDGTLCNSNYPELGPIIPGAKEALQALRDMGFRIIISSCRSCGWHWEEYYGDKPFAHAEHRPVYRAMVDWLNEHEVPYDIIDSGDKGKVSADFYIDDKGVRFENNWRDIVGFIESRQRK